ncbi:transcriptional regulator with XRE-family HTH domain [Actinokineospora baliensis]|uniref:XRE family transcriptional regulator n=1 Tax=Actinokineospora baliensis TaxID=547056 RepID=UPI001EF9A369|nr:XRE family transcriptional regulator [Actinokineospora baliensis]MBM7769955.1 transcriptional regulator with XRE-family HTH domain [Actinokineospora baliensis]
MTPPELPDEFWRRPAIQDAFRGRHFGQVLYAYRYEHRPVLTQGRIGNWLSMTQGQVSRIERARSAVYDLYKLELWARVLRIPEQHLWFRFSEQPLGAYSASAPASSVALGYEREDDVRRRELFKVIGLTASGFGWFSAPVAAATPRKSVVPTEVTMIRDMTRTFRSLDNRFGGGHARSAVTDYLTSQVAPLLRTARATDSVRVSLHAAVAELNQLAGWMAYDTGDADTGGKHLKQALRLCQQVDDDALSAEMLAGMSHQAAFFRSGVIAVDLGLAAQSLAARSGLAALESEAAVMTAHGYALQGHRSACLGALGHAERALAAAESRDRPDWLTYFDSAYLAAKSAHCFRDLGQPVESERYARESLRMSAGYDRGRLFNLSVLASALADQARVEEACATAAAAVDLAGSVRSVRTVAYLADVGRRLNRYRRSATVSDLFKRMRASAIPLPAR